MANLITIGPDVESQPLNDNFAALNDDIINIPHGLYRNAIINGNFDVWQRGATFSAVSGYTADRWKFDRTGTGTTTISRSTDVPDGKSTYSLRFSGDYAPGEVQDITYYMEGKDAAKFAGQQVTISLKQKGAVSAGSTSLQIYVAYATAPDNFVNIHQVGVSSPYAASGNFTEVVYTLTLPAVSGGYPISNGLAIIIRHTHGGATGTLTGNISQVQFCAGGSALPYQPRSFAEELALCLRYFYRMKAEQLYAQFGAGTNTSTTQAIIAVPLKTVMRIAPTLKWGGALRLASGATSEAVTNLTTAGSAATSHTMGLMATVSGGLTPAAGVVLSSLDTTAYIDFDAEM